MTTTDLMIYQLGQATGLLARFNATYGPLVGMQRIEPDFTSDPHDVSLTIDHYTVRITLHQPCGTLTYHVRATMADVDVYDGPSFAGALAMLVGHAAGVKMIGLAHDTEAPHDLP
jgi:hypothetical protein